MENWKDIKGYEGHYQISDLGRVKSLKRWINNKSNGGYFLKEKIIKTNLSNGYPVVGLNKNGKQKKIRIHQLVAIAFLNHKPCGHKLIVDHIDNNKLNNTLKNLQIVTSRFNTSKDRKGYSSEYTGVSYDKKGKNWRSFISIDRKIISLGQFDNELRASIAYQFALNQINNLREII